MTMSQQAQAAIGQFRQFIQLAVDLLPAIQPAFPSSDFARYIHQSAPLLATPIRNAVELLRPRLALIQRWLLSHDLLRIGGFTYAEDPYTELIAWALHPDTHPASAISRQAAWLNSFPFGTQFRPDAPAIPKTQVLTPDGIPDLVLEYEALAVVVEAKTAAAEHPAPSGTPQTLAYPAALRRLLGLDDSKPIYVIFITPHRTKAANRDAFNTTFVEFCMSLAPALELMSVPEESRWTYAMLFTHFFTSAVPLNIDTRSIINRSHEWFSRVHDDAFLISQLRDIKVAANVFAPEVAL